MTSQDATQQLGLLLAILAVAWGALAFGAVYPWAYWALGAIALMAGMCGFLATDSAQTGRAAGAPSASVTRGLAIGLISVAAVIGLQLVPLPISALAILNSNGLHLIRQVDPVFALSPEAHALSVWPPATRIALALFACFAVLLVGGTRLISISGAQRLVGLLILTGVLLAFIGIIQKPLYAGKIYGFWIPQQGGSPFGPFVNKNHFAGWMLMVLPLALGYLCASLDQATRGLKPGWRYRLLWLSSPEANKLIMVVMAIGVLALALVLTMSRSGIGALALAFAITGWFALRRLRGRSLKMLAGGYLVLLAALLVSWVGAETLVARFSESDWGAFKGRTGLWADAAATFKRHWITGTGVNTYQVVNLFYQRAGMESFASSAHNDYLQLAAEGGVILIVAVASCIVVFVRDVRRRFAEDGPSSAYWLRAGAVTALLAIAFQETVEFSLQIPGNAALFAVACAIALHRAPHRRIAG